MGSYLPRLSVFFIRFFKVRVFCTKFSFEGTVCGQPLTVALIFCPQKFYDGYIVADIGDCTDTEIVIPDVYNGKPVIGIDNEAFNGCKEITSVFMPDSIVIIGEEAFANCGITNITIPANLFYFGNLAFAYCSKLTKMERH